MSGYVECPCCGEVIVGEPGEGCVSCTKAGCDLAAGDNCQIPDCPECHMIAMVLNDGLWHSLCGESCPNSGKTWAS